MRCPNCRAELRAQALFCSHCGHAVRESQLAPIKPARPPKKNDPGLDHWRVLSQWHNRSGILLVEPRGAPPNAIARYLAVQLAAELDPHTLKQLGALRHPHLAHALVQVKDTQTRTPYLIVEGVLGTPLDLAQEKLGATRATKIFEKILGAMIYLHDQNWVVAQKTHGDASMVRHLARWFNRGAPTLGETGLADPVKRFQQAFALDASDNPILFDYAIWETAPAAPREREERIRQDMRLTVGMLYWLRTSGRLTKELENLRRTSGQLEQFMLNVLQEAYTNFQELGEKFSQIIQAPEPGKTLPLPPPPPVSAVTQRLPLQKLTFAAMTDAGKTRNQNEDNYLAQPFGANAGLFLVADGMGGHDAGEVASKIGIDEMYKRAVAEWETTHTAPADQVRQTLIAWLREANVRILATGRAHGINLGTTLTGALVANGVAFPLNVGDSRTYLFRSGRLHQLTRDHSLVASLVQAGLVTPAEAYTHPQRNEIFRALGQQSEITPDVFSPVQLGNEDRLIVCSDGLWEMVRPPQFEKILLEQPQPPNACAELIRAANENGGADNITLIIVRVAFE